MKPIEEWSSENLRGLEALNDNEIEGLVLELHGFLIALEKYEEMIDTIKSAADVAFVESDPITSECNDAREAYHEAVDRLLAADDINRDPTDHEKTEPDAIIRNLLEQPSVVTAAYFIDDHLRPPASAIGQLYRTELPIAEPNVAGGIYTNSMQMAGAVQIALDALESFADYHPEDPFPPEDRR